MRLPRESVHPMDYAQKRKLIEKKRELMQRAHRVVQGNKSAASTSIITRKMCFNFNDILKVEKEQHERKNFLANKLGQSFS